MEESSRQPPPPPGMEFMDSVRIPVPANAPPDILNMFNFIDSIGNSIEPVNNGAAPYITREQRMYAAEYCRLQDKIDTLTKDKEQLEDKVSKCQQELLKAREPREVSSAADKTIILELKRNENTLQSKLSEQKNQFEQIKSQFEVQTVKVREQEEVIETYKSELDEATNTVSEREQEINEYRSVVADQKVLMEKNEEKMSECKRSIVKLEEEKMNLQQRLGQKEEAISSLQVKLSDLEDDLKTKQNEVEELKKYLENERKCTKDTEASFMKLQKSVSNFNLEFSQFIDELKTVSDFERSVENGEEEPSGSGSTTAISLKKKLEMLTYRVKSKFQSWQSSQTMMKEELARIKQVMFSLTLMLDSQRPVNGAQATQSTQTEPPESSSSVPINVNESCSTVETISSALPEIMSYSCAVQPSLTSETGVEVPQSIFPADNFEFPTLSPPFPLSSMEVEPNIIPTDDIPVNVISNENESSSSMMWESFDEDDPTQNEKIGDDDNATQANKPSTSTSAAADNPQHGHDVSRKDPGYFCFCGYHHPFDKKRLLYHIQYFTADPKFSCQLCGKRFIGSNYLRRHCRRVHKIICADSTGCWKCGEQFENRKLLIEHQKSVHGRRRGIRNNIATRHKSMPSVVPALLQDNGPSTSSANKTSAQLEPETTSYAEKSARKFKIIIKHVQVLSRNGNKLPIMCVCGYKAKNEDCFRSHVKYYDKKFYFICEVCDKGFKTTSNLRGHMQSAHQISYNMKGCRLCGKVFETLEKLRYHQFIKHSKRMEENVTNPSSALASGTNPKPNARLPSPSTSSAPLPQRPKKPISRTVTTALQKRKHGVDLSKRNLGYYCICGTKGNDRKALNHHIHYFTAERKFQCEHCNLKFLHLARLKNHMKRKHKNTNIEDLGTLGCSDCGLTFHSHLELFQHRKIHASVEGVSTSTPSTHVPAQDDGTGTSDAILSLGVTTATTHDLSPTPRNTNKARSTPHAINPQSQPHPQTKRASTAPSAMSVHKPVRIGNNFDVFYCICGTQFDTGPMLHQHIEEYAQSAEGQSCVQAAQPSHSNSNADVEAISVNRNNGNVAEEAVVSPISLSRSTPSSSTSINKLEKSRPLTHAIDKSKEKFGLGLFCKCGLGFQSTVNMDQHFQFHRNGRKFSCEQCERKFKELKMLNKHKKKKHGSNMTMRSQFGCRSCGQVFFSAEDISKHRTKIFSSAGKLYKVFCPSRMLDSTNSGIVEGQGSMVQQTQMREVGETLSLDTTTMEGYEVSLDSLITDTGAAELPSTSFRNANSSGISEETNQIKELLEPHLVPPESQDRPTHGVDTSKNYLGCICFCGQQCSNKYTLNKHIKRFTAERKFICKTCGKGFLAPAILQKHMLRVHKVVTNGSIGCHKCGELFPTNMELYYHFRIVHNYGCTWEPRELKYNPSAPSSSQDFSQEEPIIAQTDPDVSSNNDERNAPQVHTALPVDPLAENKVYQCSCGKTFFTRKGLRSHIQMKAVGKIFQCLWCSYRCEVHGNLKKHVREFHKMDYQNLKYACGICAQTFATLEDVTKHRRSTHENWTRKLDKSSSSLNHAMEQ